jgi:hypothetical protein
MNTGIRNRIKGHRRVRAGDLVPHDFNFRIHPPAQENALRALYEEVGFARSLLAYELPDGRLKLIDGHLRRELDPDLEVEVEILDVNEDEARILLLSIDPLAAVADCNPALHDRLVELTPTDSEALRTLWDGAESAAEEAQALHEPQSSSRLLEQFLILITCRDEAHQLELLARFQSEGLPCKPLQS